MYQRVAARFTGCIDWLSFFRARYGVSSPQGCRVEGFAIELSKQAL